MVEVLRRVVYAPAAGDVAFSRGTPLRGLDEREFWRWSGVGIEHGDERVYIPGL